MDKLPIGLVVGMSKLAVESSNLDWLTKEKMKTGIDCAADIIKQVQKSQESIFSVMGFSLDEISAIKAAAQECGLAQVTLFPCPVNGIPTPCLKMTGGDISSFSRAIGLPSLEQASVNADEAQQEALMNQYGVILYLKKDDVTKPNPCTGTSLCD